MTLGNSKSIRTNNLYLIIINKLITSLSSLMSSVIKYNVSLLAWLYEGASLDY